MMRKCYVHLTVKKNSTAFSGHETFTKILDGVIKFITPVYMEFRTEFLFNRQIKAGKKRQACGVWG